MKEEIEPPPRWRKIKDGLYAVAISDHLQITQHGLGHALRRIPYQERRELHNRRLVERGGPGTITYQFGKEWREDGQRWIEIICR